MQLAELYRTTGEERQADSVLRVGLDRVPGSIDLQYQLGLALIRQKRIADALPYLKTAAASGVSHYAYVYGVALFEAGQAGPAVAELQKALAAAPDDQELLYAVATIAAEANQRSVALAAARRLAALNPGNADLQRLLVQLMSRPPS